ncbi:MAG: tyrosine protein phosphatase [Isosphaeraceae bacterium]
MNRRRLWVRGLLLTGLLVLVGEQTWRHGQDYIFAQKIVEVEPGKLYRGAWQHDWPMRRLVRDVHIKTVVALAHPPESPLVAQEKALARELGVHWLHIPIVEASVGGEQRTVLRSLERAADVLADPANQPVYFHCHHGLNRVSMVQMAYRMLHCGWSLDQATEEIAHTPMGLVEVRHGVDYRYMKNFYNQCVVPRRLAAGSAHSKTSR